jgi:AhpD family alkylhydroperoxidase
MPRINPIDPSLATGETATHLASVHRMLGGTPNLFTTAAHSPAALGALVSLFTYAGRTSIDARRGEQIAIAIAQRNGCGYCLSAHTALGVLHGVDPAALEAARSGSSSEPKTAALLSLAVAINQSRGHLDDATLDAARRAGITDAQIVEVVFLVALNVFTNYLNSVAGTTIDFPVVPLETSGGSTFQPNDPRVATVS